MRKNFFSKSIRAKLITLFLAVSVIPIIILGAIIMNSGSNALENNVVNKLEVLGNIKSKAIISFFDLRFKNLNSIAKLEKTLGSYRELNGRLGTQRYQDYCKEIDPYFNKFIISYGFKDVYILSGKTGRIVYSLRKSNGNLSGASKTSEINLALSDLWGKVVRSEKQAMEDYSNNGITGNHQSFIGAPIFNEDGDVEGVFVFEINTDDISKIMHEEVGFGSKYEVYLAGEDHLMRSDSKFDDEEVILKKKVNTKSVEFALKNKQGTHEIVNSNEVPVFSHFRKLGLKEYFGTDFDWAVVAELSTEDAFLEASQLREEIIIIGLLIAILVILLAIISSRYFTSPIIKLTEVAKIFANGDLSYDFGITQQDEIGKLADSIKRMQVNLKRQFEEITEGVNVLFSSSSEIMATVSQLASTAAETATSVSETTSTVEEVKQTVDVSNQRATEVADSAQTISNVSQDGTHSITETIYGMNKIKQQMESIAGIVIQLSEKSRTIGEIADSVGDLAEQSNLLAVNASIEAAKAGEQGKGFTVVAQEIKNLADRSKESTVQIRKILHDVQKEIGSAVMATEQGNKVIEEGLQLSSRANEVISTLAANIEQASQASIQIAASSQQQLIGMDQITLAMENIKEASSQTANSTKQSEDSVVELNKLGERLLKILKQYKFN